MDGITAVHGNLNHNFQQFIYLLLPGDYSGQLLFFFFSDNQTVTSIILAVMILAAVCILGPYYHWRKQEKENTQE